MPSPYLRRPCGRVTPEAPDGGHLVDLTLTAVRVMRRLDDAHRSNETANALWIAQEVARGVAAYVRQVDGPGPVAHVGQFSHWR